MLAAAAAVAGSALLLRMNEQQTGVGVLAPTAPGAVALAVLGDSDSHSYQDRVAFPPGSPERGGAHRAASLQWTEVIGRLRARSLDLGPWGTWGTGGRIARVADWLGRPSRAPRKEDYLHNFAVSGAVCRDLLDGGGRQAPRLVQLMDKDPARWRDGVVVIRIGVNSMGKEDDLDRLARDPADAEVVQRIDECLQMISGAVSTVRERHPTTRFVLVGVFDNTHWVKYAHRWHDAEQVRNIATGLDRFDQGLRTLAGSASGMVFFDDRAWFAGHWGGRDENGRPAYREVSLGQGVRVTHTAGDDPANAVLADGHAGTIWNALWARALIGVMNDAFKLGGTPLDDTELADLLRRPDGR